MSAALHHRWDGPPDAPVLVLSSSLGTTASMWDPQLPELTKFFRVLRTEHRGHGGTPAPPGPYSIADLGGDVVALLDRLGIERASFAGLSLGGMVGTWVASHHPDRVDRLALCCTAARLGPPEAWRERAATVRSDGVEALAGTLMGRWFTPGFRASHPEVPAACVAMLGEADPEGYAGCCEAIAALDLRADAGRITAPTLVLAGADDPVAPPAAAVELHELVAGSSLTVLASASHLANLEQPAAFTAALVGHLAGETYERGLAVRRAVLGADHVDRALAGADALTAPFQEYITRAAWGEIWARPGLPRETRRLLTIAMLASLGRLEELALHLRAAAADGVDDRVIGEVLLQTAVYAGVPAANAAFAVARDVLRTPPEA